MLQLVYINVIMLETVSAGEGLTENMKNLILLIFCLVLAISLVPCICEAEANAILNAATVFGGNANTIEQPIAPYTLATPAPQTFSAGNPSWETVNPAAGPPVSNAYDAYGAMSPSGTAQYEPMPQPSAQGDMPPCPELRDRRGEKRLSPGSYT